MSQFDINHKKIVLKNKTRRPVIKNKTILPASEKPIIRRSIFIAYRFFSL